MYFQIIKLAWYKFFRRRRFDLTGSLDQKQKDCQWSPFCSKIREDGSENSERAWYSRGKAAKARHEFLSSREIAQGPEATEFKLEHGTTNQYMMHNDSIRLYKKQ